MKKLIKSFFLLLLMINVLSSFGQQQPQFTQFDEARTFYNPGSVGLKPGLSGTLLGRWQWVGFEGAPTTYAASAEYGISDKQIGFGLGFVIDETAQFQSSSLQLSSSYRIQFKNDQYLSFGLSGVLNTVAENLSDAFVIESEALLSGNIQQSNFNTGLGVHFQSGDFWAGLSAPYMLNTTFQQEGVRFFNQRRHYYLQTGYKHTLSPDFDFASALQLMNTAGSAISWNANVVGWYQNIIGAGFGSRNGETFNILFKTRLKEGVNLGYAYDMIVDDNLSQLANSSHEIALTFNSDRFAKIIVGDNDGDGVKNKDDDCPNEFGLRSNGGCPLPDLDQDGVPDANDNCPQVKGKLSLAGCPDSDDDGIIDSEDECPNEKGIAEFGGCAAADADGDGVYDEDDLCPNKPGLPENKGCPEISTFTLSLLETAESEVSFMPDNPVISPSSYKVLARLSNVLKINKVYKIRIVVHTDNQGDERVKLKLSNERADALKLYLVSRGIQASRIETKGLGGAQPLTSNNTEEGKKQNERVEFDIYF